MTIGDALAVLLPTPDETAVLTAVLASGQRARGAWTGWLAGRGPAEAALCAELATMRTLMPLLAGSVARNGLATPPGVLDYMRAAALREELRAVRFREIAALSLAALEGRGTVYLLRGAALAATVYDTWSHRHCHDLDLLVGSEDVARAVRALTRVGCEPLAPPPDPRTGARVRHSSGLQIALHTRPFVPAYYEAPLDRFTADSGEAVVDGVRARVLSPEATLVHVLGHAAYSPSRQHLRWVADAWHLVSRRPALDWPRVEAELEACRLTLPVSVLLQYLAGVGVPVPAAVLERTEERAGDAPWIAEDVALGAAHAGPRGTLRNLWRSAPGWRARVRVVRWAVAPSPGYLRSAFRLPAPWLYPLWYLYRPARFIVGRFVQRSLSADGPAASGPPPTGKPRPGEVNFGPESS